MIGDRIALARARVEAAASRIEAAAGDLAGARGATSDPDLQARYNSLRTEAKAAVETIDILLARLDPEGEEA